MTDESQPCIGPTETTIRIRALLDGAGVTYRYVEHGPTRTSEESVANHSIAL